MADKTPFWHHYFAHRGLHDIKKGIPENSIAAFRAAAEAGYGIELDVQLSKDGQVVVFHDQSLKRIFKVPGRLDAFDYSELKKLKMANSEESIALFTEVLEIFDGTNLPLIVEIKMGKRNNELCQKTYELLKSYNVVYCIESFNPMIVRWFKKNAPDVLRGLLSGSKNAFKPVPSRLAKWLLIHCYFIFLCKPDFIAYEIRNRPKRILKLKNNGMMIIGWTAKSADVSLTENDAIIFENYRPDVTY